MKNSTVIFCLVFIVIQLVVVSCTKEVVIPIEDKEDKLVINAQFNTDSTWQLEVSASKYIYGSDEIALITDANVSITDDSGNEVALSHTLDGIYTANEKPIEGKSYNLNVSHNDYTNVSATNKLPASINLFDTIDWKEDILVFDEYLKTIKISIKDSDAKDYYSIRIQGVILDTVYNEKAPSIIDSINRYVFPIGMVSQNSVLDNPSLYDERISFNFTDETFNGENFVFDFHVSKTLYYTDEEEDDDKEKEDDKFVIEIPLNKILISISSVSEELYWYKTSYENYIFSQFNKFGSQPVQVYSNITDGLGIFAGHSVYMDSVSFE